MAYFKIGNVDYSQYISALTVSKETNYNAQTNAAGNTVVDKINTKRVIQVTFIPLDAATMATLQTALDKFSVSISFINPNTNALVENITCIVPTQDIEYYTIQVNNVLFNALDVEFIEL